MLYVIVSDRNRRHCFFSSTANSVKRITFENSGFFFFFSVRQREVRAKQEKSILVRCVKTVYDVTKKELAAQFCLK